MAPAVPAELDLVLPVEPPSVPAARRAVEGVAHAMGACPGTVEALRLAVSEACTNVILHAYRDSDGDTCTGDGHSDRDCCRFRAVRGNLQQNQPVVYLEQRHAGLNHL